MDTEEAKYTRVEYERRFLVSSQSNWKEFVEPYSKRLKDKYLRNTKLRLRHLTDSDTGRQIFKLTKKCDSASPYFQTISRILLSPSEYQLLDALEGDRLHKTRYYHRHPSQVFSIDVFEGELEGLILCETEAANLAALKMVQFPEYTKQEEQKTCSSRAEISAVLHRLN